MHLIAEEKGLIGWLGDLEGSEKDKLVPLMFGIWDDDSIYFKGIQITRESKTKSGVFIGKPELS